MDARTFALHGIAFVLTYAIHSTLLLGLACLVAGRIRSLWWRERLWKGALLGGIVTALIQAGIRFESPFAHWTLRPEPVADLRRSADQETAGSAGATGSGGVVDGLAAALRARAEPELDEPLASGPMLDAGPVSGEEPVESPAATESLARDPSPVRYGPGSEPSPAEQSAPAAASGWLEHGLAHWREWTTTGLAAWAAFAGIVLAVFAGMWMRLERRLRGRVEVLDGELREQLDRLVPFAFPSGRRIRLYVAPDVAAPVSFGFLRPSICVPPRALTDLVSEEQETMLAHELAHLARRDPLWLSAVWVIERVFFFQPLNRVARSELHDLAELACDSWAVSRTGNRLALASCLARIAEWIVGAPRALPATSMAEGHRSRLTRRIERLLEDGDGLADEGPRPWAAPAAAGALSCLVLVAPGVCASHEGRGVTEPDFDAAAEAPAARAATWEHEAPRAASPAGLGEELVGLDESVELLESELVALREAIAGLEPDSRLARKLGLLELRVRRLSERRDQLHALATLLERRAGAADAPSIPITVFGP